MTELKKGVKITLKEKIQETSDVYSFVFDKPEDFKWTPGQHGVFKFTDREVKEGKDFRIFSFASINEENNLLISTRIVDEPSDFKKNLLELNPGDEMTVDGPMGKFLLKELERPILVMAGGIGITPVRSFIKNVDHNEIETKDLKIMYSDDRGEFAYEEYLKSVDKEGFDLDFISDRNIFSDKIDGYAKDYKNKSLYYISGTPGMVNFLTDKLKGFGVEEENIVTDEFRGYED
jgi:ferredoxin-NADP reductase